MCIKSKAHDPGHRNRKTSKEVIALNIIQLLQVLFFLGGAGGGGSAWIHATCPEGC